jgi:hypothetical protein
MKTVLSAFLMLCLSVTTLGIGQVSASELDYSGYPTISVVSVVSDQSVTIKANNLPASDKFSVLMNYMGTKGKNGIVVGTINSGSGGTQTSSYNIPDALKGQKQIAIRIQSTTGSGYFAYNWFTNKTGGSTPPTPDSGAYSGHPFISIKSVVTNQSVTIVASNLPKGDTFVVLMNYMGTRGKKGIQVGSFESGQGGSQTLTYNIPAELHGQRQIAIRIQSSEGSGFFAYNWFYNKTGGAKPPSTSTGYSGVPIFSIKAVVRNSTVTIVTSNLPANDTFAVKMNFMGTRGVNGYQVATLASGSGGTQTLTYNTPAELYGQRQIAIRLESMSGSGYFAYNWFYNNTYP